MDSVDTPSITFQAAARPANEDVHQNRYVLASVRSAGTAI
jgi:hypothetical protein